MNPVCLFFLLIYFFFVCVCVLRRNSRWPPKVVGKQFFTKSRQLTADIRRVKNFVEIAPSRSISEINTFFVFNTEIQDGRQKWWENFFWRNNASRLCRYPACQKFCRNLSISLCVSDKHVFAFTAEIQNGHQKWQENDFWEK